MLTRVSSPVVVARIVKAHGICGEVALESFTDVAGRLENTPVFLLMNGGKLIGEVRVVSRRFFNNRHVLRFEGISTRTEAEALRGKQLAIPEEDLGSLPKDQYFIHQLIGMTVRLVSGESVGIVKNVMKTGGTDLLVVGEEEEILIPFAAGICVEVNAERKQITIDPPDGLLRLNAR